MKNLQSIDQLVASLTLFPSIGFKSAERMAYALLDMSEEDINRLVKNIENAKTKIHHETKQPVQNHLPFRGNSHIKEKRTDHAKGIKCERSAER